MHQQYVSMVPGSKTVVIFIHGIFGTPDHFRFLIEDVPDGYSVYNVLLDGHGKKAEDISQTSMKKWKSQISDIVNSLSRNFERIIIVAHSMGTLFAIDESIKHPDKIAGLFLLASPLKIFLKPLSFVTTLRMVFGICDKTPFMLYAKSAHGVEHTKRIWVYAGWLPRYFELFREIKAIRTKVNFVTVPCYVFQSAKDEMVSKSASVYFKNNPEIHLSFLMSSYHFFYDKEDQNYLKKEFQSFLRKSGKF